MKSLTKKTVMVCRAATLPVDYGYPWDWSRLDCRETGSRTWVNHWMTKNSKRVKIRRMKSWNWLVRLRIHRTKNWTMLVKIHTTKSLTQVRLPVMRRNWRRLAMRRNWKMPGHFWPVNCHSRPNQPTPEMETNTTGTTFYKSVAVVHSMKKITDTSAISHNK